MRLRATTAWAVTVLLAAVGCAKTDAGRDTGTGAGGSADGPSTPAPMALDFVRGGTRLLAMGYSSNEARVFRTFHDSQLDFDCEFVSAGEGSDERCVPRARVTVVYTDEDCTELAGWVDYGNGSDPGTAVSSAPRQVATSCPGQPPAPRGTYRLGEQISNEVFGGPSVPLFERSESGCRTAQPPGKVAPPTYRLIPLSEDELARGKRVSVDLGAGLRLVRLIGDDGAELNLGLTSNDGTPCALQRDGECVPEPIARPAPASEGKFITALNADCSEPAYEAPYWANCGDAKYGVEDDGIQPLRVHALKKVTPYFSWQLALPITEALTYNCMRFDDGGVAPPAAPDRDVTGTLPTAATVRLGDGPLYVDWYSRGQSQLLPVTGSFVNGAGEKCQITADVNGTERCAKLDSGGDAVGELTAYPEVTWGPL